MGEYSLFRIFSITYTRSVAFCERKNRNLITLVYCTWFLGLVRRLNQVRRQVEGY